MSMTLVKKGDYVNRGKNSIETIELLLCLKLKYPGHISLLRGNHEDINISKIYGFYDEVLRIYGDVLLFNKFCELFNYLPLAAIVSNEIFCVHAGLSPEFNRISELQKVERTRNIPTEGILCDILWSEPDDINGWNVIPKGAGWAFGSDIVEKVFFLIVNENNSFI